MQLNDKKECDLNRWAGGIRGVANSYFEIAVGIAARIIHHAGQGTAKARNQRDLIEAHPIKGQWIPKFLRLMLLAFVAGAMGYYLHAFKENTTMALSVERLAGFDYYVSWESFSEVDEAKSLLQASAAQFIQDLRERPGVGVYELRNATVSHEEGKEHPLSRAIQDLEQRIDEFKGTQQEFLLVQELLWILWRGGQYDHFTDTYLGMIYTQPTQVLVGHFAEKAHQSSQMAGRENEMMKAFRNVLNNPLDFESKRQIQLLLDGVNLVAEAGLPATKSSL